MTKNDQIYLIARLKKQARHGASTSDAFNALKKQAEDLYKTFEEGGKDVVRASGFTLLSDAVVNAYEKVNILEKQNRKLSESFGTNTIRAAALSKSFDKLGISIGINTDKLKIYAGELKKLFPGQAAYLANAGAFGAKISKQAELMRNKLGLSAEVTEGFIRNQALLSKASVDNFDSLDEQIAEYSKSLRGTYEGAFTDITEGIGNLDSETAAVFSRGGLGNLAKAIIESKKLGVELNKVLSTGTGLLDVEQAIGSEIELQLLGAEKINVAAIQKARLEGDALTLTKELTSYLEANGEQMKKNPFLLQKSAEALGFTNSELLDMYAQLKLNGQLENEISSTQTQRNAEIQKAIDNENAKREVKMSSLEEEIFLNDQRSESEKAMDKAQQGYAASVNTTDQVEQVTKLANLVDSSMNSALAISTKVVNGLNNSTVIEKLIGAGGFITTLDGFIKSLSNPADAGPGVQNNAAVTPKKDVFIPAGGANTIISGPKGSFSLDPDDDIIAMPNARAALANRGGTDTSAIVDALKGMSFHVTNVFDGDKIQSRLTIRQGQKLNNIS